MRTRRAKVEIVAEALQTARLGVLRISILREGKMSSEMLNRYVNFMVKARLLEEVSLNGRIGFRTSGKGIEFLQLYHEITALLETDRADSLMAYKNVQLLRSSLS